jgi:uncharacterized membrane-anchored protein
MKTFWTVALATGVACAVPALAQDNAQQAQADLVDQVNALNWVHGPATVPIGDEASMRIPKGVRYLDPAGTSKFVQLNGNPPIDNDYTIAPEDTRWFAILEFESSGYVSDKEKIDPDALFKQIKSNEDADNKERATAGQTGLHLDRWITAPHYDAVSHNLEWGTVMHTDSGEQVVNYTSRILGRDGVTKAILVSDPTNLQADLQQYRAAMSGFAYLPDKKYEDHKSGDKMAEYGLGALVAGGAAAAVMKTGLFAAILKFGVAFYKLILVGLLAVYAMMRRQIARLFKRATAGGEDQAE